MKRPWRTDHPDSGSVRQANTIQSELEFNFSWFSCCIVDITVSAATVQFIVHTKLFDLNDGNQQLGIDLQPSVETEVGNNGLPEESTTTPQFCPRILVR